MSTKKNNLIWIDLEMTGLEPKTCKILEIATVITDSQLNIIAEGPVYAINQPQSLLDGMDEWNTSHHNQSGLVKRVLESKIDERDAELKTIEFLDEYVIAGKSPMCGNSICQDRRFLYEYMPELARFFHYRNLDVSTIKELCKRWCPTIYSGFNKKPQHLALADIKDSIDELRYYRKHFIYA